MVFHARPRDKHETAHGVIDLSVRQRGEKIFEAADVVTRHDDIVLVNLGVRPVYTEACAAHEAGREPSVLITMPDTSPDETSITEITFLGFVGWRVYVVVAGRYCVKVVLVPEPAA